MMFQVSNQGDEGVVHSTTNLLELNQVSRSRLHRASFGHMTSTGHRGLCDWSMLGIRSHPGIYFFQTFTEPPMTCEKTTSTGDYQ